MAIIRRSVILTMYLTQIIHTTKLTINCPETLSRTSQYAATLSFWCLPHYLTALALDR